MGTRHMIGAVIDGEIKLAQYGQWDGYPSGQGVDVLNFLRDADLDIFANELKKLEWITEDEFSEILTGLGIEDSWMTMTQAEEFKQKYPELSRDTSSKVLTEISYGNVSKVQNDWKFGENSLFCEWAYVIDMDDRTLEVYEGFNKGPEVHGRWAKTSGAVKSPTEENLFYPVTLRAVYSLDELPTNEEFVEELEEEEEE